MNDGKALNRRNFLGSAAAMVGVPETAPSKNENNPPTAGSQQKRSGNQPHQPADKRRVIMEKPRRTPIAASVDVLVVGGGPTGVGAALAAAHAGATTLLIERHGMLGGIWTAGLLNPFFDPDKGWLVTALTSRLQAAGAWRSLHLQGNKVMKVFDVEVMKYVLEQMMSESGIEFWYHALVTDPVMEGDRVRGVFVESKSGREAVLGKVVIDCSGDGDLAARAGVPFRYGRESDGLAQPATMQFEIDGIERLGELPAGAITVHEIHAALLQAIGDYDLRIKLPYGPQRSGTPFLIALPRVGAAAIQATHVYRVDATDVRSLTKATVAARRQVHEIFMPAMSRIPGLEKIRLTQTAPALGIREARHLEGRYRLDLDDLVEARSFDDAIASINFHIDVHEIDPEDTKPKLPAFPEGRTRHDIRRGEIPYRCLLPKNHRGLLFAGRCISGSHIAHAAYRVTGTCMGMGQAAGLAGAIAAKRSASPGDIDGAELKKELARRGVSFLSSEGGWAELSYPGFWRPEATQSGPSRLYDYRGADGRIRSEM